MNKPIDYVKYMIFEKYKEEGIVKTDEMDDSQREVRDNFMKSLTQEEIDILLKKLGPERVLRQYETEDIEAYLKKIKR